MTDPLFLILDQGGSQSRAVLVDALGTVIDSRYQPVHTRRPSDFQVEQDPWQLIRSLQQAANTLLKSLTAAERTAIQACAIVCQRSSLLAWDQVAQRPLSPVLSWQDQRGAAFMPDSAAPLEQIQRISGLFPSAHHGASKCRWLLTHDRKIQRAAADNRLLWMPLATFLVHALCHITAVDPASAQRTLLWNRHRNTWDPSLARLFRLEPCQLPRIQPSLSDWGHASLGPLSLPCQLLGGDQSLAPFSEGHLAPGEVRINLGTGGFLCTSLPAPLASTRLLKSVAYSDERELYTWLEGTINGAGAALTWAREQGARDDQQEDPGLFLNAVGGLGSPDWRSGLHSRWLADNGLRSLRAVEESILFLLQRNLAAMSHCGISPRTLSLGGGLSLRPQLAQKLADLTQLPVTLAGDHEATARGAAWVLAGRPQSWSSGGKTLHPTPNNALHRRYRRWDEAMQAWLSPSAAV
ncbi:FGGY family carbohydrate kinase [Motiliproteus sediminis]|uniref:FGGY family carbohydrate kinase n=1 Tax=Motiliproteus sediminis TaxID=1468178 RepID=UPI001AF00B89|nr:FGGY family carbohydrate kinase [Motiliproteus sediminis]